ncbi:hypothetical protein C8J57DRAFT_1573660 [Mycena rebaudengoi]|nr:hypothetical protein C8J57DRAFT_1573660 [Mycena rebaudengoi]
MPAPALSFDVDFLLQGPSTRCVRIWSLRYPPRRGLVPAWNFRDDTRVGAGSDAVPARVERGRSTSADQRRGKMRRLAVDAGEEDDDEDEEGDAGKSAAAKDQKPKEKKVRRKWTPEETQMLVDGCNTHGVGNWKAILSDPSLSFAGRSPVDLKDRRHLTRTGSSGAIFPAAVVRTGSFRTYFPDAYRTHYPNARTHLPPSLARPASPSSSPNPTSSSSLITPPVASSSTSASTSTVPPTKTSTAKPNRSTHPDGTPLFPLPSPLHPKRRPFTPEEDAALLAGFRRHGAAWAAIAKDPESCFGATGRRSMDLRDRFRNAWPGEYERAGYKARTKGGKKAKEKEKAEVKEEEGGNGKDEVRGRARIGRAKTDEGLGAAVSGSGGDVGESAGGESAGGPVRRRRRAHTSQGFKSLSMPPSVVGSDDEGEGAVGGGGGATSDFGFGASSFRFQFGPGKQGVDGGHGMKGEETALVGGMRHLDMAPDETMPPPPPPPPKDEAMPDVAGPSPAPPPNKFQAHFLQHRRPTAGGGGGTIGRSAWGTQDWLSANPRLDPSSARQFDTSAAALPSTSLGFAHPHSPPQSSASLPFTITHSHSPPLSSSASFADTGDLFELAHGVMERYDLEPAALSLSHPHQHLTPGQGAYPPHAFSSPPLSFQSFHSHSNSFSFDTTHSLSQHSLSEADNDDFDRDSSAFSIADSEPAASWSGVGGGGAGMGGGGGGFRGFTHHSNTAGDLIFGARTHQPIWSGVDAWGARGRGRGLAGIAEAQGSARREEAGGAEAEGEEGDGEEKELGLFSLDDLVDLSQDPPDAEMNGGGGMEMQVEPPGTPLLRASPAPSRALHVHHHHHHHHHYAATARSVSVPPGETPEEGNGLGLGLMSAPATPALSVAGLPPRGGFDPTLLSLAAAPEPPALHSTHSTLQLGQLMSPDTMYDLRFLDLHYFGGGGLGDADVQQMQMQTEGWRQGEALDLARSSSSSGGATSQGFPPSAFSFAQLQTQPQPQPTTPPPSTWKAPAAQVPVRPQTAGTRSISTRSSVPSVRSVSHQRGQSAVVRPRDLMPNSSETGGSLKGKRKRASWDGGVW